MKIFLYISIIVIMIASFVLVSAGDVSPFVLSFFIIPIIIAGNLYGIVWAYLVSAVFTAFCIGLTKLGLGILPMFLSVVSFNIVPLIVFKYNTIFNDYKQDCKDRIVITEGAYQQLLREDAEIKKYNAQLERDVLEMAQLYEITKAMSANMEFAGIFNVLKNVLEKTFKFSSAKLILFSKNITTDVYPIEKIYKILPVDHATYFEEEKKFIRLGANAPVLLETGEQAFTQAVDNIVEPSDFDRELLKIYPKQDRKPLVVGLDRPDLYSGKISLPQEVGSLVAVGLFYEDRPIGVLSMDNITKEQIDRFLIVAGQFELELQKVKLYEMVQQLSILDGLTGIFVRRHFIERSQDELRRSMKHKLNLSCLMIDVDLFKNCNDKYGHLVGDVVLKRIAEIIKENIREVDFVGRYGGEEFCIMLPDTSKIGAVNVAERLKIAVENSIFNAYDENVKITISIGTSIFPEDASDLNQLIDFADQAMYKAKSEGRNKVCTWS